MVVFLSFGLASPAILLEEPSDFGPCSLDGDTPGKVLNPPFRLLVDLIVVRPSLLPSRNF